MKKKLAIIMTVFFIAICCLGCTSVGSSGFNEEAPETQAQGYVNEREDTLLPDWSIENSIDSAPVIFEGSCVRKTESGQPGAADMDFRVSAVLRGDLTAGSVVNVIGEQEDFEPGCCYLLMAEPYASVYSGKELYYYPSCSILKRDDGLCACMFETIDGTLYDEVFGTVRQRIADRPYSGSNEVVGAFCTSDSIDEIADFSDFIAVVRPESIYLNEGDRTCYTCSVLSVLKGEPDGNEIVVISFKNSMEIGSEYVVLLSKTTSKGDGFYTMSSIKSLIPAGAREAEELFRLFG